MTNRGGLMKVLDKDRTKDPADTTLPRYYFMEIWGTVSKGPKLDARAKDGMPRVQFGVRYRRGKFVNMIVLKTNPFTYEIASRLRMGDKVHIDGVMREYPFTKKGKKGGPDELAWGQDGYPDIILPERLFAMWIESMDASQAPDTMSTLFNNMMDDTNEEVSQW